VTAIIGVLIFSAGLHGYFLTHSRLWHCVVLVIAGLLLIDPHVSTDIIGLVLAAVVVAAQLATKRAAMAKVEIVAE
jgi:TRAP-type uncharacterized transport system fused permease subunit